LIFLFLNRKSGLTSKATLVAWKVISHTKEDHLESTSGLTIKKNGELCHVHKISVSIKIELIFYFPGLNLLLQLQKR